MKRFALFAAMLLGAISVPSMAEFTVAQAVGPPAQFAPYDDASGLTALASVSEVQAVCLVSAGLEHASTYHDMTATGLVSLTYAPLAHRHAVEVGGWPS